MTAEQFAAFCRAARATPRRDGGVRDGEPLEVSTWIRLRALFAAERELAGPPRVARSFVLRIRMSDDEREMLKLAASRTGEPFSSFMLRAALDHLRSKSA